MFDLHSMFAGIGVVNKPYGDNGLIQQIMNI